MSFIIINNNEQLIDHITTSESEMVYLYKDNEHKFPLLSSLDNFSHTFFYTDDMINELISELNFAKAEMEGGELIGQSIAEVLEYVDSIISLARKCKEHQNDTLIHTPFQ
jgi:hypothetical protein